MHISVLLIFALAQCHSSMADWSPDSLPSLDGSEPSPLDNVDLFATDMGGPTDPLFLSVPDESGLLFPETDPNSLGTSFETGLGGGGLDLLAASDNECYPKERACCLRASYNQCYYAPSSQCAGRAIVCCSRVNDVTLAGVDCSPPSQPAPQTLNEPPADSEEIYPGLDDELLPQEDYLDLILGF